MKRCPICFGDLTVGGTCDNEWCAAAYIHKTEPGLVMYGFFDAGVTIKNLVEYKWHCDLFGNGGVSLNFTAPQTPGLLRRILSRIILGSKWSKAK